jgi:phytoene dehydrogenase-like protein
MPYDPDLGGQHYEDLKREFADKIIEKWSRYASNMTRKNIIGQYVYTPREYVAQFPQMRGGDIFMGAFNAEQVMYNHFGYRTPVGRLYMVGSAAHPGGAISGGSGYISAGIIARDLGLKLWWRPWDAREALTATAAAAE